MKVPDSLSRCQDVNLMLEVTCSGKSSTCFPYVPEHTGEIKYPMRSLCKY